jgi:two-component sensor histidine kinase
VLHDDAGRPTRMIGVNLNITKQKAAEEWERQITLEMGHRVKNIISVVHALASQSLTAGSDPGLFSLASLRSPRLTRCW